jgi:hypothetical protein
MDTKVLQLLLRNLQECLNGVHEAITKGAAADYAAYQNLVGQARGLAAAQMEVNDLLRKLKDAADAAT